MRRRREQYAAHQSAYAAWESEAACGAWTQAEAVHKAHAQGAPSGVTAGPPRLERWEVILDEGD